MTNKRFENFKYHIEEPGFIECFINNGFVIAKSVFPPSLIKEIFEFVSGRYEDAKNNFLKSNPNKPLPVLGLSKNIVEEFEKSPLHSRMTRSNELLDGMEKLLGPDLALINFTNLWINDPCDNSIVTAKSLHQEAWSGWSLGDISIWVPLHKPSVENTLSVIPGSHYYGLMPNQNRKLICPSGFELTSPVPLILEEGEAVLFHSLLLHATSGRGESVRYASSFVIKNSLSPLNWINCSKGFVGIRSGPLSKIQSVLGNEYLTPLRTYGGKLSNDENLTDDL